VALSAIDLVYVHAPDRLARSYAHQVLLLEEFAHAGTQVIFLNHPIGTTPEDSLLLQLQGMFAEYERAKVLERSRRGKRHRAHTGAVSVLSRAPSATATSRVRLAEETPATRSMKRPPRSCARSSPGSGTSA
jgi:site-specific DNA recombinase